ncbi:ATP-binding protein [Bosea sp. TAB14]|uniref:ATP-binding protein n=1 Tax=Bosea sp. TAB14 TaxID=3237481 RepID=UPI003F8EFE5A
MSIESDFHVIDLLRSSLSEPQRRLLDVRERLKGRYIQTDWDDDLRAKFDTLLRSVLSRRIVAGWPLPETRLEARCLVVTGEAGTGKTESLDRLFRTHPVLQPRGEQRSPLIRVTVPAPCTLKTLGRELLRALGYPLSRELADHIIWARIHELLPAAGVLLIHLDEMHNLTDGANSLQLDNIRKALKGLMVSPDWPVGLIISGLPGLVPEMRRVDEIRRRGQFVSVPLLQLPRDLDMIEGLILGLAEVANVEISNAQPTEIAPRLIHAALYRLGVAIELIHEAIEHALAEKKPLGTEQFATAFTDRTGCASPMNPFIASGWAELDCTLVLANEPPVDPEWQPLSKARRGRGSKKGGRS